MNSAQIILLLISADFLASRYCTSVEMQRALERHEAGEARVIAIILRPVSWEGALFSKLQLLPRDGIPVTSKQWESRDEAWTHVVNELRKVIASLNLSPLPAPSSTPTPRIWHVPYRRNPVFTGREELLKQLYDRFTTLHASSAVALTQSQAINGLGGIGKTQTALEYAYRYQQEYRAVLWVSAASEGTLQAELVKLAQVLGVAQQQVQDQQQAIAAVKAWLATQQDWLLILDNADDLPMACSYLPDNMSARGHVLLTTRAQAAGTLAHMVEVEQMEPAEGALLLLRRARVLTPEAALEQATAKARSDAEVIVAELGGLPLAIDQAAAYIEETGCGLSGYLDLYRLRRKDLLLRRSTLPASHPEPVATTWSLSFRLVEQANPAAADLLRLCAFLDPDAIPEVMLSEGKEHVGPVLSPVVADPFALNQAIAELRKFSLIRRNADIRLLSLHRLVQAVLRDGMTEEQQREWATRAVLLVNTAFPDVEFAVWERCRRYLPHAIMCAAHIEHYTLITPEAATLLNKAGLYLDDQAQYQQALPLFQRALAISEQALGPDHPHTATVLNNLAHLYKDWGNYEQALPLYQRALAISEQVLGPDHAHTSITLNDLAGVYWHRLNFKQALPLYQRALAISEQVLGPDHPHTSVILTNLSKIYRFQGNYEQALPLCQRALAISEQVLGPDHPHTAASLHNLAGLYRMQGDYEQALPLFQRALTIREQVLGPDHPRTATTLNSLARVYRMQGNYEQALLLYQRALAIREQVLEPDHPHTAITLNDLARLYQDQGNYQQAESFYQRALEIDEHAFGPEHHQVATDLESYATLLEQMNRAAEAAKLRERAQAIRAKRQE